MTRKIDDCSVTIVDQLNVMQKVRQEIDMKMVLLLDQKDAVISRQMESIALKDCEIAHIKD